MHEGRVYEVHPGDEMELQTIPQVRGVPLPGWQKVQKKAKGATE